MFFDQGMEDFDTPHNDLFIVKVQISNAMISRVLMDNRLRVNVLFKDAAEKMGILDNINKGRITLHTFNEAL